MTASTEHDPFDLDAQAARAEDRQLRDRVAVDNQKDDLAWMLSGRRGRRIVRRQLREAGALPGSISSSFHSNYGQMCFNEGLRVKGLQLLSRITQLLVHGEIPFENYQLLFMETDE